MIKHGKVEPSVLKRSVINNIKNNKEFITKHRFGEDAIGFKHNGHEYLTASAMREGNNYRLAAFAIHTAVNNIMAKLGRPLGVSIILTLPKDTEESILKQWIRLIHKTCEELNIGVLSGHTSISQNISVAMISITAIGVSMGEQAKGCYIGASVLMTKYAGMEGTLRFIDDYKEKLLNRYTTSFLEIGKKMEQDVSVLKETTLLNGKDVICHDISEGGVFAALWELCEYVSCGITIDLKAIPLRQITIELCEYLDRNPYMLLSSGSLLIVTRQPEEILDLLHNNEIRAVKIGVLTDSNDRILMNDKEIRFLEPYRGDTYYGS